MRHIGVFCSSHEGLAPEFVAAAEWLGGEIGRRGATLVYGGSRCGLMEVVATAVKKAGGRVTGVVPDVLRRRGLESEQADVVLYTAGLADRKETLLRESDVLVALPGGLGTLDEVFTVVAAATLGEHRKRVVLADVAGCWDPLLALLEKMQEQGLVAPTWREHLLVARSRQALTSILFPPD